MVEGHVTKLKLIKRTMYGRAGFPLLRQRVLHALSPDGQTLAFEGVFALIFAQFKKVTGEFKIEEAKKESERELQRLLGKPSTVPMSSSPHPPLSMSAPTAPLPGHAHASSRIERASYRDPVGEQVVITTSTKCSYLGIIEVTRRQFQEAGTTCVECPTCGARRTLKSPKDRPHFPSHPLRKSPPPKGERRWIEQEQIWKLVED